MRLERARRARLAARAFNGGAAWVSNSSVSSVCHLAIVERLCIGRGIAGMALRYFMREGIAVLHEHGAEHRQIPKRLVVVLAAVLERVAEERALLQDGRGIEQLVGSAY